MSLELHHLHLSQSERIVWLLEEMQIPYKLIIHERDPITAMAPESLKGLTPAGTAPYLEDKSVSPPVSLVESGAIVQYLIEKYGTSAKGARMNRSPGDPGYADYLDWFHFSNGSLMPTLMRARSLVVADQRDHPVTTMALGRLKSAAERMDSHLANNKFFAGEEISAADCMIVTILTTIRGFIPYNLGPYSNILRYLKDVAARPAYKEAVKKGDKDMKPLIEAIEPSFTQFERLKVSNEPLF